MIKRLLMRVLKVIVTIVGILAVGIVLFFVWLRYTSPVNEAGREYQKKVRSYQNTEIESMDHVFERIEVLNNHFNSPTSHKVQGGEKREVTFSDIQTLFGEPDRVFEDVQMRHANTVYQYHYDDLTLNIHEGFSYIEEYVLEEFTGTLYNSQALDQMLIDAIVNHQALSTKEEGKFEPLREENVNQLANNKTPTRKVENSGWYSWAASPIYYFDNGEGEYAPNEYLLLTVDEDWEYTTKILAMERRYNEAHEGKDLKKEVEMKREAFYSLKDRFENEEFDHLDEKILVKDISDDFGDISKVVYIFRDGNLRISWLIKGQEHTLEITAELPVTDVKNISTIEDLMELEVIEFNYQYLYGFDNSLENTMFIGSK